MYAKITRSSQNQSFLHLHSRFPNRLERSFIQHNGIPPKSFGAHPTTQGSSNSSIFHSILHTKSISIFIQHNRIPPKSLLFALYLFNNPYHVCKDQLPPVPIMSTVPFPVYKSAGTFVQPDKPTPLGSILLSPIDNNFLAGTFVETILVFHPRGSKAACAIREDLGKALVSYYPLAGRVATSEHGELAVNCTGDGVWFVEATADYDLPEEVRKIPRAELFSYPENPAGSLVMFQVTQFTCGGSIIGFVYDHCVADGIGMAQFFYAVVNTARDVSTIVPVWCRDAIPGPPKTPFPPPEDFLLPTSPNHFFDVDISSDKIRKLKAQFQQETGRTCSRFEVLTAITWQARTRAIDMEHDADVTLSFAACIRHLICNALPAGSAGYYGNCVFPLVVTAGHGKLVTASIGEVVDMIRDTKAGLPNQVSKWLKGEVNPFRLKSGNNLMFMVDWLRLGFDEEDYTIGKPEYFEPVTDKISDAVAFLVKLPTPKLGVRLITKCVTEENLSAFQYQIRKAFDV